MVGDPLKTFECIGLGFPCCRPGIAQKARPGSHALVGYSARVSTAVFRPPWPPTLGHSVTSEQNWRSMALSPIASVSFCLSVLGADRLAFCFAFRQMINSLRILRDTRLEASMAAELKSMKQVLVSVLQTSIPDASYNAVDRAGKGCPCAPTWCQVLWASSPPPASRTFAWSLLAIY